MPETGTVVAVAQLALAVGELDANREAAREAIAETAIAGARLAVLPELSDSGYVVSDVAAPRSSTRPAPGRCTARCTCGTRRRQFSRLAMTCRPSLSCRSAASES